MSNPKVFFDIAINDSPAGRITFEVRFFLVDEGSSGSFVAARTRALCDLC
jgi:hypothetical protein